MIAPGRKKGRGRCFERALGRERGGWGGRGGGRGGRGWRRCAVGCGRDEVGQLAASFNKMTEQLVEQRDKLVQAERVAAWRELARRLAHELKNPLFPLQTTVENLRKAR